MFGSRDIFVFVLHFVWPSAWGGVGVPRVDDGDKAWRPGRYMPNAMHMKHGLPCLGRLCAWYVMRGQRLSASATVVDMFRLRYQPYRQTGREGEREAEMEALSPGKRHPSVAHVSSSRCGGAQVHPTGIGLNGNAPHDP